MESTLPFLFDIVTSARGDAVDTVHMARAAPSPSDVSSSIMTSLSGMDSADADQPAFRRSEIVGLVCGFRDVIISSYHARYKR